MHEVLASIGLDNYEGETLFLKGGRSDYITEDDHMAIQMQFMRSMIESIEDAGHWLHAEQPDAFFAHVEYFLS